MDPADIDIVILCGGMGTRLSSVVNDRPKPMAQIDGRPFLDILIEHISGFGFKRFILCTGHKSEVVREYYKNKQTPLEMVISEEQKPLGTAGAVKNAEAKITSDIFLVVNGDSFCPADMQSFVDYHKGSNAIASVVLAKDKERKDCGKVVIDEMFRVCSFSEKCDSIGTGYINAGVYCFQKELLAIIPENKKCSLEYDVFPGLAKDRFLGFVTDKSVLDIGTPERYESAQKLIVSNDIYPDGIV